MQLDILDALRPSTVHADRLIVRNSQGTAIAVFVQDGDAVLHATIWGDKDFQNTLYNLGLHEAASCELYVPQPLTRT